MVLNAGKLNVERLLGGDPAGKKFYQLVVGTSNTPVTQADTAITNPVVAAITSVLYLANNVVEFNANLDASVPAMTINEVGIYNQDNVLCYRKVVPSRSKVVGLSLDIHYRIKVQ